MPPKQRSRRSAAAAAFKPPSNYLFDEAVYGSENSSTLPYAYNCASASADHKSLNTVNEVYNFSAFDGIDTTKDSHASPRESTEHTDERPAERFPDDDAPMVEKERIIANESNRSESIRNTADASPRPTVDPSNMLLFRLADQIARLSADHNASASSDPIRIKQAVGELKASEGIFAFLNKFETVMNFKGIHENLWLNHSASLTHRQAL